MDRIHFTVVSDWKGMSVKISLTFLKQDCFKQNWTEHKKVHKTAKAAGKDEEIPCASKFFFYLQAHEYMYTLEY